VLYIPAFFREAEMPLKKRAPLPSLTRSNVKRVFTYLTDITIRNTTDLKYFHKLEKRKLDLLGKIRGNLLNLWQKKQC
jgi:hypothetical protein